ncbi:hypothetical protein K474DRAFT_1708885 [Panus rudis PR-1116 ss-1]|nr:hypothetical protein K474DRAFT_1708885 [Panus rudis PR-1116 ss-1]
MTTPPPGFLYGFLSGMIVLFCLALILHGLTLAQVIVFALNASKDPAWMKAMVGSVFMLDTLHSAFMIAIIVKYTLRISDSLELLRWVDWTVASLLLCHTLLMFVVQGFYVRRIWTYAERRISKIIIPAFLVLARFAFFMMMVVFCYQDPAWRKFHTSSLKIAVEVANTLVVVADAWIAITMLHLLLKSHTKFERTDGILRWFMTHAINTGALSVVISICVLIAFEKLPGQLVFLGLLALESKVSSNGMLGALNSRILLREQVTSIICEMERDVTGVGRRMQVQLTSNGHPQRIEIFQETVQITDSQGHVDDDTQESVDGTKKTEAVC